MIDAIAYLLATSWLGYALHCADQALAMRRSVRQLLNHPDRIKENR